MKNEINLKITGATLLNVDEARNLLTADERAYSNWWWLRTPGYFLFCSIEVNPDGSVNRNGNYVNDSSVCVRPALTIENLDSSNLKIGDTFKIKEYEFRVISANLAWLYRQDIGNCTFHKELEADDVNDYEKSDIKKFVDEWFEKEVLNYV